ncbi:Uncharacterised protein [Mycobacteroides abscessus subsp. abscessus]|nr:Uncharacterised protein [Mycobacteroides abscessus subsp. abscessus]
MVASDFRRDRLVADVGCGPDARGGCRWCCVVHRRQVPGRFGQRRPGRGGLARRTLPQRPRQRCAVASGAAGRPDCRWGWIGDPDGLAYPAPVCDHRGHPCAACYRRDFGGDGVGGRGESGLVARTLRPLHVGDRSLAESCRDRRGHRGTDVLGRWFGPGLVHPGHGAAGSRGVPTGLRGRRWTGWPTWGRSNVPAAITGWPAAPRLQQWQLRPPWAGSEQRNQYLQRKPCIRTGPVTNRRAAVDAGAAVSGQP